MISENLCEVFKNLLVVAINLLVVAILFWFMAIEKEMSASHCTKLGLTELFFYLVLKFVLKRTYVIEQILTL